MCLILSKNTLANIFSYGKLGTVGLRRRNQPKVQQLQFINHLTKNVCMYLTYSCFLTPIGGRLLIPYMRQNFRQRLILCIGTKISPIARVAFQEVVGGARELLCAYVCACECVKIFTVQKIMEKIFANSMHWRKFSHGKNFCVYYYTVCFPPS